MSLAIVVGTRPETIKLAPVIKELEKRGISFTFIHTGQHYDYMLSLKFIEELELPKPDYSFKLRSSRPASQMGEMVVKLERVLRRCKPKLMTIQGDTNTMLAAALAGVKLFIPVGHVEAGLRSYDWRMPEEHNRRMVDHVSTLLFAPTELAKQNLLNEKVYGKVYVTGNTVVDAVKQCLPLAEKTSHIMEEIPFKDYILATVHRAENVDDPKVLRNFVEVFLKAPLPVVFPVHPRTAKNLRRFNLMKKLKESNNVLLLPPIGYFDFLLLMKYCTLIMTDSGGLQEEATVPEIRKPVLVLRLSTERPEAVEAGFARVVGVDKRKILKTLHEVVEKPLSLPSCSPFGDGFASQRIVDIAIDFLRQ